MVASPARYRMYIVGDLAIDTEARRVYACGRFVRLPYQEYTILVYLARHLGHACSYRHLVTHALGDLYVGASDVHRVRELVRKLRRRLGLPPGRVLYTVAKYGYILIDEPHDA